MLHQHQGYHACCQLQLLAHQLLLQVLLQRQVAALAVSQQLHSAAALRCLTLHVPANTHVARVNKRVYFPCAVGRVPTISVHSMWTSHFHAHEVLALARAAKTQLITQYQCCVLQVTTRDDVPGARHPL
eukprot:GHUV01030354.1.p1 GENE.GHUV01030354.1~~GHUV01030354.1.p1  ORF type:complete len:129 (-),score=31.34 GHUV01030354.1:704-1090(-)